MDTIEAQGTRLIVDSSSFEMLSVRDPFMPQVPQGKVPAPHVEPVIPVEVSVPVVPVPVEESPVDMPDMPKPEDISLPPVPEKPFPNLDVLGLIWNTERPQAIINGQIVGIGDMIFEVEIVDIQKTGVTVLFHGRTATLEIKPKF